MASRVLLASYLTPEEIVEYKRAYRREWQRKHYAKNREARLAHNKKWQQDNPEKFSRSLRKRMLKSRYGLTMAEFDLMWEAQSGQCASCTSALVRGRIGHAVDHCHTTGRVRALLCSPCNLSLGLLKESPEALRALANYAETVCAIN